MTDIRKLCGRVAIFLPSMRGGGAERVMLTLAGGLAERGIEVDLVLSDGVGPYMDKIPACINVVSLGKPSVLRSLPALIRYLRRRRPRCLLTAQGHANVAGILAGLCANSDTDVVVTEHTMLSTSIGRSKSLYVRAIGVLMRLTYPLSKAIVAVSNGVADDVASFLGLDRSKVSTIYNPVVSDELTHVDVIDVGEPWLQDKEHPVIIAAGRLAKEKNYPMLLLAFLEVRSAIDARLIILGEGPERRDLESIIEVNGLADYVRMPGFVDNPAAYMKRSSVFVLSSLREGLPTALIEAMACGLPVISTNCPSGPEEILEGGRWGLLVPSDDHYALARSIVHVLEALDLPDAVQRARDFTVESSVSRYLELLQLDVRE